MRHSLLSVVLFIALFGAILSSKSMAQDSGVWRGRWTSETTGHSGPMRVRITPRSDGQLDARFTGRFAVVLPFTYKTTLTPVAYDEFGTAVYAHKKLGPVLGSYEMHGNLNPDQFQAGFQAGKDSGRVQMERIR